jgi:hypothetical protein
MPRLSVAKLLVPTGAAVGAGGTATLRAAGPFEGPWQLGTSGTSCLGAWRLDTKTGHMEYCKISGLGGGLCDVMPPPKTTD